VESTRRLHSISDQVILEILLFFWREIWIFFRHEFLKSQGWLERKICKNCGKVQTVRNCCAPNSHFSTLKQLLIIEILHFKIMQTIWWINTSQTRQSVSIVRSIFKLVKLSAILCFISQAPTEKNNKFSHSANSLSKKLLIKRLCNFLLHSFH
jgi:hypothetical protein